MAAMATMRHAQVLRTVLDFPFCPQRNSVANAGNQLRRSLAERTSHLQGGVGLGLQQPVCTERRGLAVRGSLGSDGETSTTTVEARPSAAMQESASQKRKEASLEEYQQLKSELTRLTGVITGLGTAYCFLGYSLESALSFAFGCIFSVTYLQELFKAADSASKGNVPVLFQGRLPRQRTPAGNRVSTSALVGSFERVLEGLRLSLSSSRLFLPGVMVLAWAASRGATGGGGDAAWLHLELAPLLLGFFTYKAAVLVITFRDQVDSF